MKSKINEIISGIEQVQSDFSEKEVHYDSEHYKYCKKYFEESIGYLKGVLYYMR